MPADSDAAQRPVSPPDQAAASGPGPLAALRAELEKTRREAAQRAARIEALQAELARAQPLLCQLPGLQAHRAMQAEKIARLEQALSAAAKDLDAARLDVEAWRAKAERAEWGAYVLTSDLHRAADRNERLSRRQANEPGRHEAAAQAELREREAALEALEKELARRLTAIEEAVATFGEQLDGQAGAAR